MSLQINEELVPEKALKEAIMQLLSGCMNTGLNRTHARQFLLYYINSPLNSSIVHFASP